MSDGTTLAAFFDQLRRAMVTRVAPPASVPARSSVARSGTQTTAAPVAAPRARASAAVALTAAPARSDPTRLTTFFSALRNALAAQSLSVHSQRSSTPTQAVSSSQAFATFFSELGPLLAEQRRAGMRFDPLDVLELARSEIRSCRVLKWLLLPSASHGLAVAPLAELTELVNRKGSRLSPHPANFPLPPPVGDGTKVKADDPCGVDNKRRIDIVIEDDAFVIGIEAKIDHDESDGQVHTYAEYCQDLAKGRPWVIVFLTPDGRGASTAGIYAKQVIPLSWRELASHLDFELSKMFDREEFRNDYRVHARNHFVASFLRHIRMFSNKRK